MSFLQTLSLYISFIDRVAQRYYGKKTIIDYGQY